MRKSPVRRSPPRHDRFGAALEASVARRLIESYGDALARAGTDDDRGSLAIPRGATPIAPAVLAEAQPDAPTRRAMAAVYERCLAHYRDVVRADDTARGIDDVGGAAAHFVVENLRALRGDRVDPRALPRLARQLAAVLRDTPAWEHASASERQLWFEKLATLAVFMHELADHALLQGVGAAGRVRQAAHRYLRELLGLTPERLEVGPDGLALRPHVAHAAPPA